MKRMSAIHFSFPLLCILLTGSGIRAQKPIWDSPYAYFGEKQPGDTPVVFSKLADSGYWVGSRVAFTEDGTQFIYGTNTNWQNGKNQRLKYFHFVEKKWKGPYLLFLHYGSPTFAMDGKTLLISGRNGGVDQTYYSDSGWVQPQPFLRRSYALYNLMPTLSGRYYLASNGTWGQKSDFNSWKFSVLAGVGSDTAVFSLGPPLNSPGYNGDFYISPDESYMIISTKETLSFDAELYISFKKENQAWSVPLSLGPLINNGTAHRWGAYVSPDKKFLFYTKGSSEKDCTIYWVRFDKLLAKLRKETLGNDILK
jgi:WD40-like Beta Propeller Repeat